MSDPRRGLPAIHRLVDAALVARYGQARVTEAARAVLAEARAAGVVPSLEDAQDRVRRRLRVGVTPVINATGVLLHTNLGRAPWAPRAIAAASAAAGPAAVELDLETGGRGGRGAGIRARLQALVGAEDALVVNNCAAAVMLALTTLAHGQDVLVSRGELVEIGGGFRVPAVVTASGARLREVGTTNRTWIKDFREALDPSVAAILSVHHSNFRQIGFVARPTYAELASLGVPLVVDQGSGALWPTADGDPTVSEALAAGALVCFSGDKLLGGPQAGIVVGRAEQVEPLRKHPLFRALRVDKTIDAALEGTLDAWLTGDALPVRDLPAVPLEVLAAECARWHAAVAGLEARVIEVDGAVGGGSLPGVVRPSMALAIKAPAPEALLVALRRGDPPVIGRIHQGALLLDARTVGAQGDGLITALQSAVHSMR